MLIELARREKNAGIKPDEDLDLFMKAHTHSFFLPFKEKISRFFFLFKINIINFIHGHKLIYSRCFLQSLALGGQETNLVVEYIMKVFPKYCYSWMHSELSCDCDLKYLLPCFLFWNTFSTNGIRDAK